MREEGHRGIRLNDPLFPQGAQELSPRLRPPETGSCIPAPGKTALPGSPTGSRILAQGKTASPGSPTGSCILAQGKTASAVAALGKGRSPNGRLKVCCIGSCKIVRMRQAFSLRTLIFNPPRALPWASMREPVGLEKGCGDLPTTSRGRPPSRLHCLRKNLRVLPCHRSPETQKRELRREERNRFR